MGLEMWIQTHTKLSSLGSSLYYLFFYFFCLYFVLVRRMWVIRLPLTLAVKGNLLLLVSLFMLLFMFLLRTIHEILFQLAFRQCRPKA